MISFKELGNLGRLGNQLFQIATTVALAIRNNDDYVFPPWEYAQYFSLTNCFSTNISNTKTYSEPSFNYTPIPYQTDLNLQGYFQSAKYFEDQQDIIQSLFATKFAFGMNYGYTSIHVRRGDYINLTKEYEQLDLSYYNKAMETIGSSKFIVFSDDIAWCRANFHGDNISFSEGRSPAEDLAYMMSCENQIIANSSFSWWAAYLNKNPGKMVIAPAKWFGPALPHDTKDLIPEKWIKV